MDFDQIKERVPLLDYLHSRGIKEKKDRKILCPVHNEKTPSCQLYISEYHVDDHWYCYGCGAGGDVIDMAKHLEGIDARALMEKWGVRCEQVDLLTSYKPKPVYYEPTIEDRQHMKSCCFRLALDRMLCDKIGRARGWSGVTIYELAMEGSLGWTPEKHICFVYRHGLKERWKNGQERRFAWSIGQAGPTPWRAEFLPNYEKVIVCEGETDAISLINAGYEKRGSLVIATAGSTVLPEGPPFIGKEVLTAFDSDEAGKIATKKIVEKLKPYAKTIRSHRWQTTERATP